MLAPARIPVAAGKKMEKTEKKLFPSRKSGPRLDSNVESEKERLVYDLQLQSVLILKHRLHYY